MNLFKREKLDEIKIRQEKWESNALKPLLDRYPERAMEFITTSSTPVNRIYTPLDLDLMNFDYVTDIGFPGEFPYTRGIQPTMYRGRLWTMRQYAGYGSAEETNKRFKLLLEQGQTGLSVAFDLPTQIGYDSDHPLALGEVGKVGVAIDTLKDMEILFDGIPLDKVSTSMTINAPATILLAMYMALAEKQGISQGKLKGTIQNDILKEYSARGTYIFPPRPSMRLITDIFEYCSQHMPKWNTISISGYHMREAGCTAIQEVAFTFANAIAYVEAARKKGIEIDNFAGRLSFFWCCHNDFFEEIAKFRAARRLWAKIMKDRFNAKDLRSWQMRFHTQTAGCSLTAQQPENNIVRVTIQALAAACGGTQSLHTNSMDEALALPSEKAAQVALKTQQIIAYESGVALTIDPLAGSYYVEAMTNEIERRAIDYIKKIDEMGGAVVAIERGFIQREIQESAYNYQKEIESKKRIIVGVNEFIIGEEPEIEILRVDPEVEKIQLRRLAKIKKERNNLKVQQSLEEIKRIAKSDENLIPSIINAVKAYATLGEICDILRDVFGEYLATEII